MHYPSIVMNPLLMILNARLTGFKICISCLHVMLMERLGFVISLIFKHDILIWVWWKWNDDREDCNFGFDCSVVYVHWFNVQSEMYAEHNVFGCMHSIFLWLLGEKCIMREHVFGYCDWQPLHDGWKEQLYDITILFLLILFLSPIFVLFFK